MHLFPECTNPFKDAGREIAPFAPYMVPGHYLLTDSLSRHTTVSFGAESPFARCENCLSGIL